MSVLGVQRTHDALACPTPSARQVAVLITLALVAACSSPVNDGRANTSKSGTSPRWRNWSMVEAEIYFAALDSLLTQRFAPDSAWEVIDTVYWWPLANPRPRVPLEETPVALRQVGRESRRVVTLTAFEDAVSRDGAPRSSGPVVIFGPIDMVGENQALFRVNVYLGVHGQELSRVRCQRINGAWKVIEVAPEVST